MGQKNCSQNNNFDRASAYQINSDEAFSVNRLRSYLTQVLPELSGEFSTVQYINGQSNPTFLLQYEKTKVVLRKKPPGRLLPSAHQIEREFHVIGILAKCNIPVPSVFHLCDDSSIIGTPFYLMEWIPGDICQNPSLPGINPENRRKIYESMAIILAHIHKIDWKNVGLEDFGKHKNFIDRQITLWGRQYKAAQTQDIPEMDYLIKWLARNMPQTYETTLIHGDFRLGNLIINSDKTSINAVLDWELSTLGNPMADLAYNCLPYYLPSDGQNLIEGLQNIDFEKLNIPDEEKYLSIYCHGIDIADGITDWQFYLTFAMFRLAVISQGVFVRSVQGNSSAPNASQFGKRAIQLAKIACEIKPNF